MDTEKDKLVKAQITIIGTEDEIERIKSAFEWLKILLGVSRPELYKRALLRFAKDSKLKAELIKTIQEEKEQVIKEYLNKNGSQ